MAYIQENRICQNCKKDFIIEPDDFGFYEKMKVPIPTFCPECRLVRRLAWRNEKSLYKNECQKCKKTIISVYPRDSNIVVFCRPCWWGDDWNDLKSGRSIDYSKNFFSQLQNLLHKAPVPDLFGLYHTLTNSLYTNMVSDLKNCYMITHSDFSENCLYGSIVESSKDCTDNTMLQNSELCYENVDCQKCYKTNYSVDCANCRDLYFCQNCIDCSDCFGCVNLRSKKYHIFNKPYSREEYQEEIKNYQLHSYKNIQESKEQVFDFWKKFPQKWMHERQNSHVSGDYIYNSKNVFDSFVIANMENSRFCTFVSVGPKTTDCYDFTHFGTSSELMYESLQSGNHVSNLKFCWYCVSNNNDLEYCISTAGCKSCFGCVGLKKKQYCILNKQYAKEEYEKLVPEIKKHMDETPYVDKLGLVYKYGEFFPIELSPFGYNTTTAQEFFSLNKEEVDKKGYIWKESEERNYKIDILPENLPDNIGSVNDEILSKVIGCEHKGQCNETCMMAFKIVPNELNFYKRMNLPLPHLCSNCRHFQRNKFRNPLKLWHRKCMRKGCQNEFKTSYAPERTEIVYCEKCYQQEVY
jgi:hypothetical protein